MGVAHVESTFFCQMQTNLMRVMDGPEDKIDMETDILENKDEVPR